jgi:hypothetical protein
MVAESVTPAGRTRLTKNITRFCIMSRHGASVAAHRIKLLVECRLLYAHLLAQQLAAAQPLQGLQTEQQGI